MIDFFIDLDTKVFLFLNGLNHPLLDPVMVTLSESAVLFGFFLILFFSYGSKKIGKNILLAFCFLILSVGLSDAISARVFKPTFKRLRPCMNQELRPKVHLAGKKCSAGKYGFVSSHAANTFAAALFLFLLFGRFNKLFGLLFVMAALVSYSRIYLAKHYPLDLIFGGMLGMLLAWLSFWLYEKTLNRYFKPCR